MIVVSVLLDIIVGMGLNQLGIGSWWPYVSIVVEALYWYFVAVYVNAVYDSGGVAIPSIHVMKQSNKKMLHILHPAQWGTIWKRFRKWGYPTWLLILMIVLTSAALVYFLFFTSSSDGQSVFDIWYDYHMKYAE
ncbi:MAG: hypothetical protein K6E52_00600 [Bacteroidaceae bacterium]|nr:hypothetical protein [Bacteroidaceae bacterium]